MIGDLRPGAVLGMRTRTGHPRHARFLDIPAHKPESLALEGRKDTASPLLSCLLSLPFVLSHHHRIILEYQFPFLSHIEEGKHSSGVWAASSQQQQGK